MNDINILLQARLNHALSQKNINADIATLQENLRHIKLKANIDSSQVSNLKNSVKNVDTVVKKTTSGITSGFDEGTKSIGRMQIMMENAYKFMRFYLVGGVLVGIVRGFRNAIDTISEIDNQLTQLRKVTGENLNTMAKFAFQANEVAKNMGATTAEVIEQTTAWARLGYAIEEASKLAEQSVLLSVVGNMEVERASTALISTLKAFGIQVDKEGKNVERVIDVINEIGNNFAISQQDIAEILQRSSSAMAEAGNTIEEIIALGVGGQEIVQDANRIGTALRTVSMRIRGVSEDSEDLSDLIPTLEKQFKSIGLSLKKDNDTFKSTYEIIKDLSTVWDDLTDMRRADILESVAGKRQGQIIAAMINNFESVEASLKSAENSVGSAQAEFERAMDSIAFKSNKLKETMTEMWMKAIDRESIKTLLDSLTGIASGLGFVVDKFGLFMPILIMLGMHFLKVGAFAKGFGTQMALNASLATASGVKLSFLSNIIATLGKSYALTTLKAIGLKVATIGLQAVMSLGLSLAITALISGISILFGKVVNTSKAFEEQKQKIRELSTEVESLVSELKTLQEIEEPTDKQKEKISLLEKELDIKQKLLNIEKEQVAVQTIERDAYNIGILDEEISRTSVALNELESLYEDYENTKQEFHNSTTENFESNQKKMIDAEQKLINKQISLQDSVTNLIESYKILGREVPEHILKTQQRLDELANTVVEVAEKTEKATEETRNYRKELEEFHKKTNDQVSALTSLASSYQALNSGEKLSLQNILELIDKYPKVAEYINLTNDLTLQRGKILEIVWNEEKKVIQSRLKAKKEEAENDVKLIRQRILAEASYVEYMSGNYPKELRQELYQAEKALNNILSSIRSVESIKIDTIGGVKVKKQTEEYKAQINTLYELEEALNSINNQLDRNKTLTDLADEADQNKFLQERIFLLKQQQQALHNINEARRSMIRQNISRLQSVGFDISYNAPTNQLLVNNMERLSKFTGDAAKEYERLINEILSLNNANQQGSQRWWEVKKAIEDVIKSQEDLIKSQNDLIIKQEEERLQSIKSIEEKVVQVIRKSIEEEMRIRKEAHDKRIQQLNDELQLFKDVINEQIKALDDQESQITFEEELAKKTEEKSNLQSQINKLMLDDSLTARNERMKLEEQLADKEEEIAKFLRKHNVDQRKEALNESLKLKEEEINGRIKQENKELEAYEKLQNQRLEKDRIYAEAHKMLMENTFDEIKEIILEFEDRWGEGMTAAGDSIKDNIISNLQTVQSLLSSIGISSSDMSASGALQSAYNKTQSNIDTASNSSSVIGRMIARSAEWHNASPERRKQLEKDNLDDGTSMGWNRVNGIWYKPDGTRAYDKGGEASGIGVMVKKTIEPERILSPEQTKAFNKLVDYLPNIMNYMPKFNIPKITPVGVSGDNSFSIGNIHLNVAKINDNLDIKKVANDVVNEINNINRRRGIVRPV